MIVVADTSPPLHLGRIGRLDLLPAVVGRVTVPRTVWGELVQVGTRSDVAQAIEAADWIDVVDDPIAQELGLDPGETAAILLAERIHADALLIDERRGVYDSTAPWAAPRLIATARDGRVVHHGTGPAWLDRALSENDP
jgi:hypothetical protein